MSYLIVGASSGLGKSLAYELASNKKDIIVISRDARDLYALKKDIEYKFHTKVKILQIDFSKIQNIKKNIKLKKFFFKKIEGILFPIGQMHEFDSIALDEKNIGSLLSSNFTSITFLISKYIKLKENSSGLIIGFGSVSAYMGRKANPYYSASKRALESFFESLILTNENKNINIQFYILGYLETSLSFGKKLVLPKASVEKLAKKVYKNRLKKNIKFIYPLWWILIIIILKLLPFRLSLLFFKLFKL